MICRVGSLAIALGEDVVSVILFCTVEAVDPTEPSRNRFFSGGEGCLDPEASRDEDMCNVDSSCARENG
jgi:hypothetical protein